MRIGIDATGVSGINGGAPSGVENYTIEIARNLVEVDQHNEYYIYCRNGIPQQFADLSPKVSVRVLRSRNRKLLQQIRLPIAAFSDRLDVMFFPFNSASLLFPCKSVVTIHDLHPYVIPEQFHQVVSAHSGGNKVRTGINKWYWKAMLRAASKKNRVIAVSEATKRDLETYFHTPRENIDVVYEGVDTGRFNCEDDSSDMASFCTRYDLPGRYILCVGTHAYKNLDGAIKSFGIVKKKLHTSLKLVIAGSKNSIRREVFQLVRDENLESEIVFTDFFPDEDLKYLYRRAELFLFPSLYEGFGLPVLEAFACSTPVVTSQAGALPEVGGDAALLVDPNDPDDIASAVLRLLSDTELGDCKRRSGYARAKEFSWGSAAKKTVEVIEKAFTS